MGEACRLVHVVCGEDDRGAPPGRRAEEPGKGDPRPVVQADRRLVQQDQGGFVRQGLDEPEFPPHPIGVCRDRVAPPLQKIEESEEGFEPLTRRRRVHAVGTGEEPGVLVAGERLPVGGMVKEHPGAAHHRTPVRRERNGPFVGRGEAGDDLQQGGLPRPVGPEETEDLPFPYVERDPVERPDGAEPFLHVPQGDNHSVITGTQGGWTG